MLNGLNGIYSLICSNNHLYEIVTGLRQPMLSLPKPIPMQFLLFKTTTCLTQVVTTFFAPLPLPPKNEKKNKVINVYKNWIIYNIL